MFASKAEVGAQRQKPPSNKTSAAKEEAKNDVAFFVSLALA